MRVLVTGASGFIAAHIIRLLLDHGHSVVAAVRSQAKADAFSAQYPSTPPSLLSFAIVPDLTADAAFDRAVVAHPPLDAVIHTASPIGSASSPDRVVPDLVDPALKGTTGLLQSVNALAPSVRRVVYTSSFAAIKNNLAGADPGHTYSDADWNPVTLDDALQNPRLAYMASKKLAERAAWDFVANVRPNFDLVSLNPPMVFGPLALPLASLDALNNSNHRVRDMMLGVMRDQLADTVVHSYADVRDVAAAHVAAIETPAAGGKRFFLAAGMYCNKDIAEALRSALPKYDSQLPWPDAPGGGWPDGGIYSVDHGRAVAMLGATFRPLRESVVDLARMLEPLVDARLRA